MSIENEIHKLGWVMEQTRQPCLPEMWRAAQGHFYTPYRADPAMVLADLQAMKISDKSKQTPKETKGNSK